MIQFYRSKGRSGNLGCARGRKTTLSDDQIAQNISGSDPGAPFTVPSHSNGRQQNQSGVQVTVLSLSGQYMIRLSQAVCTSYVPHRTLSLCHLTYTQKQ